MVVLRNVSRQVSGTFKCEVLAEYPSFEKDAKEAPMEVIGEAPKSFFGVLFCFNCAKG